MKKKKKNYLLLQEQEPLDTCKSKHVITVMLLLTVAINQDLIHPVIKNLMENLEFFHSHTRSPSNKLIRIVLLTIKKRKRIVLLVD